jgi:hypothetical protein
MVIGDFRRSTQGGVHEISARLTPAGAGAEPFRIWFRFPEQYA